MKQAICRSSMSRRNLVILTMKQALCQAVFHNVLRLSLQLNKQFAFQSLHDVLL